MCRTSTRGLSGKSRITSRRCCSCSTFATTSSCERSALRDCSLTETLTDCARAQQVRRGLAARVSHSAADSQFHGAICAATHRADVRCRVLQASCSQSVCRLNIADKDRKKIASSNCDLHRRFHASCAGCTVPGQFIPTVSFVFPSPELKRSAGNEVRWCCTCFR